MIQPSRRFIAISFACLLPWALFAEAPVVDESENFAVLEQNAAADEQPLAREQITSNDRYNHQESIDREYNDEQPIARESASIKNNNGSLLNEVQSLKQEVQELRGQLEMQTHELSLLKEQQLSFYKDLDARLRGGSSAPQSPNPSFPAPPKPITSSEVNKQTDMGALKKVIPVTTNSPSSSNNPAEEQIRYLAAYDLIKTKHFQEAIAAMQSFADQYPKGGYTANAHYWLGELYMTQKAYPEAITHFDTVLQQFPSSSKSAPSLLKIGYALAAAGKNPDAIVRLKEVIKRYPDTQTAKLAEEKLKMLRR